MDDRLDGEAVSAALDALACFPEGVVVTDADHRTRYANSAALGYLSSTWAELRGRDYRETFPESKGTPFDELYRRVMGTRQAEEVDDFYAPLGRWFRCRAAPCGPGLMVVFSDITDGRRQRTQLLQDLELLQQVVDHAAVGIVLKDLDGRYLLVNRAAAQPTGAPPEEAIGHTAADHYPQEIADRLRALELEVQRTGQAAHREQVVEYRPGEPQAFLSVTFPVHDRHGRLVATGAVHADVTRWRQAEAELATSERRFQDVFRATTLGLLLVTTSGRVVEVNDAACAILGYERERLVGAEMTDLAPDASAWEARKQRMLERGADGYEIEDELCRPDGTTVPVLANVKLVEGNGEPLCSIILRDLTEVRALQQQLVGAERMEAVGRLAAGISHDVNNVLAAISGYTQLLSDALDEPSLVRHVNGIFRSVERASDMVAQLLAFSRQQHLELDDIELCAVVMDLEDMLRRLLPAGTDLTVDCQRIGAVRTDAAQLQQVLLNLVLNARDALPDGGHIGIAVDAVGLEGEARDAEGELPPGRYARVAVTDDGVGMPPEVASRCFEPFFTTRQGSGGHGLGLSTAFGIARQTGGDLRVTSEPGRGTRFELLLPLGQPAPGADGDGTTGAMIVLAEDDPDVRNVVEELLTRQGHRVLSAADGGAAVQLAGTSGVAPDVLVTDIDMPGLDGPSVAAALRERWPDLPVLFISGAHADPASLSGRFLRKPFTGAQLVAAIEVLVSGARP